MYCRSDFFVYGLIFAVILGYILVENIISSDHCISVHFITLNATLQQLIYILAYNVANMKSSGAQLSASEGYLRSYAGQMRGQVRGQAEQTGGQSACAKADSMSDEPPTPYLLLPIHTPPYHIISYVYHIPRQLLLQPSSGISPYPTVGSGPLMK
jgi:hypothetical protein